MPGGATFFVVPLDLEASVLMLGVAGLYQLLRFRALVVVVRLLVQNVYRMCSLTAVECVLLLL